LALAPLLELNRAIASPFTKLKRVQMRQQMVSSHHPTPLLCGSARSIEETSFKLCFYKLIHSESLIFGQTKHQLITFAIVLAFNALHLTRL